MSLRHGAVCLLGELAPCASPPAAKLASNFHLAQLLLL